VLPIVMSFKFDKSQLPCFYLQSRLGLFADVFCTDVFLLSRSVVSDLNYNRHQVLDVTSYMKIHEVTDIQRGVEC